MNLEKCKKKIMRFKYLLNTSHILIRSIAWCLRSICKIRADLLPCMKINAGSLPHPVMQRPRLIDSLR
uniref:CSON012912 protein n=1 Tax=Culicoides sonorensis TaxID=179676 RepID=A0A336M6L5_CULSO